jgi:hypothetical protein
MLLSFLVYWNKLPSRLVNSLFYNSNKIAKIMLRSGKGFKSFEEICVSAVEKYITLSLGKKLARFVGIDVNLFPYS